MELPEEFLSRMKERLGKDFPAFLRSYELPPRRGLRVNTLKISAEEFARRTPFPLGEPVCGDLACREIAAERAGADVWHFAGLYYLQEPSAMTVGMAVKEFQKRRVLDLCAAPGGKTTHVAALMAGEGILVANETEPSRAKILSQNVERMGIRNCAVTNSSPEKIARCFPSFFDLVLVDAPCSGEGMFRKEPNAVGEWSAANVAMCAARQRGILDEAAKTVEEGGRLVYSTCTFSEEEDERQTEEFLRRHPEFSLLREEKLYPHTFRGEGHYFAVFEKEKGTPYSENKYRTHKNARAEGALSAFWKDFFGEELRGETDTLPDGRMYLVPEGMPEIGVRLLRLGTELGEWDGKIFKPAHALASAFGKKAKRKLILSREEAKRYLHGETADTSLPDGWAAVCAEEFPLGLAKCVHGVAKNHFPKALRLFNP